MSFVDEDDIMNLTEGLARDMFQQVLDVDLGEFPRMTWHEAMRRFGSDKPDLRIDMELVDIADLLQNVEFKVFAGPAKDPEGRVTVLRVPGGAQLTRKQIDGYTDFVGQYGARGLAWIKVNDRDAGLEGLQSPIVKFIEDEVEGILERSGAQTGDLLFFGADTATVVSDALGALRVKVGHDLDMVREGWAPLWVVDFPMFEKTKDGGLTALHHPFTAPTCSPDELIANPLAANSRTYDMVLNGTELGGGSIRIHEPEMQNAVFQVLGIDEADREEKFGFLLNALKYGAPPHGGLAFGWTVW